MKSLVNKVSESVKTEYSIDIKKLKQLIGIPKEEAVFKIYDITGTLYIKTTKPVQSE